MAWYITAGYLRQGTLRQGILRQGILQCHISLHREKGNGHILTPVRPKPFLTIAFEILRRALQAVLYMCTMTSYGA